MYRTFTIFFSFVQHTWIPAHDNVQCNLVLTSMLGLFKCPRYIGNLVISGLKTYNKKKIGPTKLPCYMGYLVITELIITQFHCISDTVNWLINFTNLQDGSYRITKRDYILKDITLNKKTKHRNIKH